MRGMTRTCRGCAQPGDVRTSGGCWDTNPADRAPRSKAVALASAGARAPRGSPFTSLALAREPSLCPAPPGSIIIFRLPCLRTMAALVASVLVSCKIEASAFAAAPGTADSQQSSADGGIPPLATCASPEGANVLSWNPFIIVREQFLSTGECDHLVALARGNLSRSIVGGGSEDASVSEHRTSTSTLFDWSTEADDPVVRSVLERIHATAAIPPWHGEKIQAARYGYARKARAAWWFAEGLADLRIPVVRVAQHVQGRGVLLLPL